MSTDRAWEFAAVVDGLDASLHWESNVSVRCSDRRTIRSRIVTSRLLRSLRVDRGRHRDHDWLTVQQRTKFAQRRDREARVLFVGELLTGERIQHPGRDGHLYVIRELDDHAVPRIASQPPNDRYGFAVEGMVTVVNDRGGRFMGSVRMRSGTRSRPIYSSVVMISARFRNCLGTAT